MRMGRQVFPHDRNGPDGLTHFPSVATEEQVTRLRLGPTRGERGSVFCKSTAGDWSLNWRDVDCADCHERFDAAVDAAIASVT